ALLEPWRPIAFGRPQAPALPAGLRIVDAGVEALGVEAERIGYAQRHHLAVDEGREAVVFIRGRDRHVIAETNRIVLIDPGVVARLGAVVADAGKTRPRIFVEGPALRTMIAGCGWTIERPFTFRTIEAAEMAAGKRDPHHTLGINVAAARTEARQRYVVNFGQLGLRVEPQYARPASENTDGVPDRTVGRMWHHRVTAAEYPHVFVRVHLLSRLGVIVELAVAIGVEHERRPALRLLGVTGLVENCGVQPSRYGTAAARPKRVVLVESELEVMRAETGVDVSELRRFRVEHRQLPFIAVERKGLGKRISRAFAAECRRAGSVIGAGHPQPAFGVKHVVVIV